MTYSDQIERTSDGDYTDYPTMDEFQALEQVLKDMNAHNEIHLDADAGPFDNDPDNRGELPTERFYRQSRS